MKRFIVKLIVVVALLVALSSSALIAGHAHALVACQPLVHFPCTGGGIVCVDKHGHVHRWHGRIHDGWHCVAI